MRKTLHLIVHKKWFDLIKSGEKKEEYREITKYWKERLCDKDNKIKYFDTITFSNGYAKDRPQFEIELLGAYAGEGSSSWGAIPNKVYYIFELGKIIKES